MNQQDSFKDLMHKVVAKHLPDEYIFLEINGDSIFQDLYAGNLTGHQDGHADKHGVADLATAKTVIEIVSVLLTTFKLFTEIKSLRSKNERPSVGSIQEQWERRLKEAGIKSSKAKAIAAEFINDMAALG